MRVRADGFWKNVTTPFPASTRGTRAGSAFHSTARVEDRAQPSGIEVVDFEEVACHRECSASAEDSNTDDKMVTASEISSSVTSSGGANRSALGVTALTISPASRHRCATSRASNWASSSAASSNPSPRTATTPETFSSDADEQRSRACRPLRDPFPFHDREDGARGARGERLAPERRRVITRAERLRDVRARPARADRHTVAERLGHRDDVGADLRVLEAEPTAGASEAGLHLVHDQQRLALVAQLAHRLQVLGRRGIHAAFALHRLEEHRRHPIVERGGEHVDVGERDLTEPGRQRLKRLLLLGLTGRGERRERAPVKRAVRGHDVVALGPAVRLAVPARELDRGLVGLGARVAEEHAAAAAEQAIERGPQRGLLIVVVQVRRVQQRARLRRDRGRDLGMGVAERGHREPGEEVEVGLVFGVVQAGARRRARRRPGDARTSA